MLLFIYYLFQFCGNLDIFQYISCYCLSKQYKAQCRNSTDFNTSHVTVYHWHKRKLCRVCCISIHLMLLFIQILSVCAFVSPSFQYISCYCLSYNHNILPALLIYFNTSHVTVYRFPCVVSSILSRYFNTSHVTVYLGRKQPSEHFLLFQYISCYCLSENSNHV